VPVAAELAADEFPELTTRYGLLVERGGVIGGPPRQLLRLMRTQRSSSIVRNYLVQAPNGALFNVADSMIEVRVVAVVCLPLGACFGMVGLFSLPMLASLHCQYPPFSPTMRCTLLCMVLQLCHCRPLFVSLFCPQAARFGVARVRDVVAEAARRDGQTAPLAGSAAEDSLLMGLRRLNKVGCTYHQAHAAVQRQHLNGGAILPWKSSANDHTVASHSQLGCEVRCDFLHAMWSGGTQFLHARNVFLGSDGARAVRALQQEVALETARIVLLKKTRSGNFITWSNDPVVLAARAAASDHLVHARDPLTLASLQVR
jgi:hypothetical protein